MNINWDANKYSSDFSFVHQYGNSLIDLIDSGCKTVLDLGCGNGALSKALSDKGYNVTGIDASKDFLEIARKNYPEIKFIEADATNFSVQQPFDAVFSNAVFHWINKENQKNLLKCVHKALKKNGQFVFEFGGYGNNKLIHEMLKETFLEHKYNYEMPFYFPTISEYSALLESNGFRVTYAVLFDRPTELKGENGLKDWIEMFVKTPFCKVKDEDEKRKIIDEAVENLRNTLYKDGKWYADYVRIRMKAVRL